MSYDIYSLHVDPGEASAVALETIIQRDDLVEGAPLDPGKEARKRSIANALTTARGMGYELVEHDYASLAESEGITPDEARRQVRHLQVDNGVLLVEIDDEYATVKVPYSSQLVDPHVADDVFRTLRLLRHEAGLMPYDPQLERELDIETDRDAFLESFRRGVEDARERGAEEDVAQGPRPPWWKRLLGR